MKLAMKFRSTSAIRMMGLVGRVIGANVFIGAVNEDCGSVPLPGRGISYPFREVMHSISLIALVLAILTMGCHAKVLPAVIVRVPILVIGESPIGNLLPHQGEDHTMSGVHSLQPLPLKFNNDVPGISFSSISPRWNSSGFSGGFLGEPLVGVVPFEVGAWSFFPSQDSSLRIVRKALLQILPRWERFYQIHSSVMDLGALFGVSPVGAPLSLLHVKPTFN